MHAVVADWEIAAGSGIDEVERVLPRSVAAKTDFAERQFELGLIVVALVKRPSSAACWAREVWKRFRSRRFVEATLRRLPNAS